MTNCGDFPRSSMCENCNNRFSSVEGLYVVTAYTKSVLGMHEFRLTNLLKEDIWVKLKRGSHDGLLFTPVRKVLTMED